MLMRETKLWAKMEPKRFIGVDPLFVVIKVKLKEKHYEEKENDWKHDCRERKSLPLHCYVFMRMFASEREFG